jgi:LuxR family transcriptional regulator, maltose regulon positive regulatory protein
MENHMIPQPVDLAVPRPRLVARLDQPWYRLGLVTAPPGSGKTTILADWARHHQDAVVWVSCEPPCGEPTAFWRTMVAALRGRWSGLGDDAAVLLEREGESIDVGISLANELGEVGDRATIVIDDMHLARPTPVVLLTFIQALPDNIRMVLGSRVDLPFSLARLKVTGQVMEIREDELRFSPDESARFLAAEGMAITPEELERLYQLTEGWPAGLRMAMLSMRQDADPSRLLHSFSGTDRAVTDFLITEVLDRLPPEVVQFMLETSILDSFDASLCAAVAGREDAQRHLAQLWEAHLFLVPMDTSGERFRYHHLFGEFLVARLKAHGPDRVQSARLRAAEALLARGDLLGALRQVTLVNDPQRAAAILLSGSLKTLDVADRDMSASVARAWLAEFGGEQLGTDPYRVLEFVTILMVASGSEETVWWLRQAELEHPVPSPEVEALIAGLWASYHLIHGQAEVAIEKASQAMAAIERAGHREGLLSTGAIVLSRAHLQAGHPEAAKAVMNQIALGPPGSVVVDQVRASGVSAYAAASAGDLTEAVSAAETAMRMADRMQLSLHEPGRMLGSLAMAAVAIERNKLEEAGQLLDRARLGAEETGRPDFLSLVALEEARWLVAMGDIEGAFGRIDNVRIWFPHRSASVETRLATMSARLAVQAADESATTLLSQLPPSPAGYVLRARAALSGGETRLASELLEQSAPEMTTRRERVEVDVLSALAWLSRDADLAMERLKQALSLAYPEALVRTIIDLGPGVPKLLAAFPMESWLNDYVDVLIEAADTAIPIGRRVVQTALVDPLTDRELVVLRYLSSRLTYPEIASLLHISVNTLKSHIRAVHRKLDVDSRSGAVRMGRSLRLL